MSRLKISIINRDIVYLLIFFVLFVSAHSQERDKEAFTLMRKITKYDAEGLKYVSITKKDCIALKTCYYTRKGDSIDSFNWKINEKYLQPIITQYFIDNKSEIWLLFLIAHSKR